MEKRLFLLDAYALIYRAYYALVRSPRFTADGLNTSAIFGFCNTLEDLLRKENPTHLAVCFDPSGGTFRHEAFDAYKANRQKQPEDITLAVPYIKRILEAYRIPVIEVPGYEADDVIGTLAKRAAAEGYDTFMMTPDKDYAQLVGPHIYMYRPPLKGSGFEVRGADRVCELFDVQTPEQVIDYLALVGDSSDNIPGCPKVGPTTAVKLIREFGSVEGLLDNIDKLKGALRTNVADNVEQIKLSKWLATICTDVPVDISISSLERRALDPDALRTIYSELEFRSFIVKLNEKYPPRPAAPADSSGMGSLFDFASADDAVASPSAAAYTHTVASDFTAAARAVEEAMRAESVGIAVYALGDEAMNGDPIAIALSYKDHEATYLPLPSSEAELRELAVALAPLFAEGAPVTVSHDLKRVWLYLRRMGVELASPYFDTAVADYVIDPERRHHLAVLVPKYLGESVPESLADTKKLVLKKPLELSEAVTRFCCEADYARRLRKPLMAEITERDMTALLTEIEFPLIRVLMDMEWTGVRIDSAVLTELSGRLSARIREMEQEVYALAGGEFNIASPAQVGMVLFDRLQIDPSVKPKSTGSYSTTEAILEKYAARVPVVALIMKIRRLRKLVTTYLDTLPALVNPATHKIHTTFNQTVTATGRISSANPNLQNIPVRTDDGREIRRAFIPDEGDLLMSADYSQIELRLIAHLSGDPDMIEAFHSGADIHALTASKVYHTPLAEVTEAQRRNAKTANFGIIYGISAFGLSERLSIPRAEAKQLIDGYFHSYPQVREYLDKAVEKAREAGFVTTSLGRRRYLPDITSRNAVVRSYAERNAVNAPIQGTAADIIKVAMIRIFDEISRRGLRSRMIMQVHDELIFNVVPSETAELQEIVSRGMTQAFSAAVPLEISMGVAPNWLEAH